MLGWVGIVQIKVLADIGEAESQALAGGYRSG